MILLFGASTLNYHKRINWLLGDNPSHFISPRFDTYSMHVSGRNAIILKTETSLGLLVSKIRISSSAMP